MVKPSEFEKTSVSDQITPVIWYESKNLKYLAGLLITIIAHILALAGLDDKFFAEEATKFVEPTLLLVEFILGTLAVRSRTTKASPPVALTKKGLAELKRDMGPASA